jgi:hypothetical protein
MPSAPGAAQVGAQCFSRENSQKEKRQRGRLQKNTCAHQFITVLTVKRSAFHHTENPDAKRAQHGHHGYDHKGKESRGHHLL